MDITPLVIKICSGNLNVHQKRVQDKLYSLITNSDTFFLLVDHKDISIVSCVFVQINLICHKHQDLFTCG